MRVAQKKRPGRRLSTHSLLKPIREQGAAQVGVPRLEVGCWSLCERELETLKPCFVVEVSFGALATSCSTEAPPSESPSDSLPQQK